MRWTTPAVSGTRSGKAGPPAFAGSARCALCLLVLAMAQRADADRVPELAVGPELKEGAPALEAKIAKVTVFSDRARIERRARAEVKAGLTLYRLPDLPGTILLDTVRVSAAGARVVRTEASPVERERTSVAELEGLVGQIEKVAAQIAEVQ